MPPTPTPRAHNPLLAHPYAIGNQPNTGRHPSNDSRTTQSPPPDDTARQISIVDSKIKRAARDFCIPQIKEEQIAAVRSCITGRDSIVTLPTGFGKSLCFQLVPKISKGTVIIICPLIALAADQVRSLRGRGYAALMFRGRRRLGIKQDGNWKVWRQFREGKLHYRTFKFSVGSCHRLTSQTPDGLPITDFMTPEFALSSFRRMYAALDFHERPAIPLLAVDEAHLIEGWYEGPASFARVLYVPDRPRTRD